MTAKKLLLFLFLQWVIFTLAKILLLNGQVFFSAAFQEWFYWSVIAVVSVALVRRFGVINYFEVFFVMAIWIFVDLFFDLVITSNYTTLAIFKNFDYWIGYLVMFLAVMIFHKKRHVQVRKELHAKHHAHGGHH